MNSTPDDPPSIPLGKEVKYSRVYDPQLLFKIQRPERTGLSAQYGFDRWISYELTWLQTNGIPRNAVLEIIIPAESRFIVESKSLKLYLGSFSLEKMTDDQALLNIIQKDLIALLGCDEIKGTIVSIDEIDKLQVQLPAGISIDSESCESPQYENPCADILKTDNSRVQETLCSNLFRFLCPVTAQPDYATVIISYAGRKIIRNSLLAYLLSYRNHSGFHETCCEKIFSDILRVCGPDKLTVVCNFNRRGGIEINPLRSNLPVESEKFCSRLVRQ